MGCAAAHANLGEYVMAKLLPLHSKWTAPRLGPQGDSSFNPTWGKGQVLLQACDRGSNTDITKSTQRMLKLAGQVLKGGEERLGQFAMAKLLPSTQQVDNTRDRASRR